MEIYKDIDGFSNYEVSNFGNVRNKKTRRFLKQSGNGCGYLRVNLCENGKLKTFLVHRLVANVFISNYENKPQVNHIDGDKTNNRLENLEWVTREENMEHASSNGLLNPNIKGFEIGWKKSKERSLKIRCIETGQEFESISSASRYFGVHLNSIQQSIHKGHKVLKKYHFELIK